MHLSLWSGLFPYKLNRIQLCTPWNPHDVDVKTFKNVPIQDFLLIFNLSFFSIDSTLDICAEMSNFSASSSENKEISSSCKITHEITTCNDLICKNTNIDLRSICIIMCSMSTWACNHIWYEGVFKISAKWSTHRAQISTKARSSSVLILLVVNGPYPKLLDQCLHLDQDILKLLRRIKCVQISTKARQWSGSPPKLITCFFYYPWPNHKQGLRCK